MGHTPLPARVMSIHSWLLAPTVAGFGVDRMWEGQRGRGEGGKEMQTE